MPKKEDIESSGIKIEIYLLVIAALLVIVCYYNLKLIIPSIILFVFIILYSIWINDKSKSQMVKQIQELTSETNSIIKNSVTSSPFPLIIMKSNGEIIWKNNQFMQEFANVNIKDYLITISKEIKIEFESTNNISISKEIKIEDKTYDIFAQCIKQKNKNEYYISLYMVNNSNYIEILKRYQEENTCIGIITIDNYEEIIQRMSAEEKPQILAAIEKSIYDWTNPTGGLVIKTDRETYIYVFEQKYLEQLEENKFNILDNIKDIDISGQYQLTVSISISGEGDSNYEKYKSALSGMDIALGRGGDQAVIKAGKQYKFYGGRTQEVEKRTKAKARIVSHALEELILEAKNVVIMGHKNGDIDSIGSSLGLYRLARTLNKDAYIVNSTFGLTLEKLIEEIEKEEEYNDVIIDKQDALGIVEEDTLLIIVDTHIVDFVEVPELLAQTNKIVVIDHHRKSTDAIENPILIFHEAYASSTAELVIETLQYSDNTIELKQIEVEALYAGIMMDTKNFTFKTGVRTFEAAAYLRKFGVDIIKVKKWFQSDLENYNIIADIVKNAEIIRTTIGIAVSEQKNKDATYICAKAADELLSISTITASFVIGNLGDKICISGRSIGDINVQLILEKLGGGGHITTAGAQLEGKTAEEVKSELLLKIEEYFKEIV